MSGRHALPGFGRFTRPTRIAKRGRHYAETATEREARESLVAAVAEIWPPVPAVHVHDFKIVAEFSGIRAAITECACGTTSTIWRTKVEA